MDQYKEICNEYLVPQATAKLTRHKRDSYMVGALARLNLNYDQLSRNAKEVAEVFGLRPTNFNPFMNSIAQLVEVVHSMEDSIRLIDDIVKDGIKDEKPSFPVRAGRRGGSTEVPRGSLFHECDPCISCSTHYIFLEESKKQEEKDGKTKSSRY